MNQTPHLGLNVIDFSDRDKKATIQDCLNLIAGDSKTSNMELIDTAISKQDNKIEGLSMEQADAAAEQAKASATQALSSANIATQKASEATAEANRAKAECDSIHLIQRAPPLSLLDTAVLFPAPTLAQL